MDALDNIQRTGRWLVIACTVAQVVVGFGAVFGLVSSALCVLGAPVPTRFLSEATNNGIFESDVYPKETYFYDYADESTLFFRLK